MANDAQVAAGRKLADSTCSVCHNVTPGGGRSPNPAAPSFSRLAALPGFTEMSVRVLLQSNHRTMPQLKFTAAETDNIAAYMMSLRPDD
jgi:mono/diheme cytochrome c family protein